MEQRYAETVKEMEACEDKVRAEMLRRRSQEEQDAIDNQRFLVDNLEFQQLEVCFSYICFCVPFCRMYVRTYVNMSPAETREDYVHYYSL